MKYRALILVTAIVIAAGNLRAQDDLRGPDGGATTRVSGVEVLSIPDLPFNGKSHVEWTRTLEDGSMVTVHLEANVARDSQGRIYRERRSFVPANAAGPGRLNEIHIYDPVTRSQTICSVRTYRCIRSYFAPRTFFNPTPEGWNAENTRYLARESLSSDVMYGQNVTGTRETTTTNPGTLGNDRALVSTRKFWYSAELKTNLAVTRNDPREGKQVIRLTELSRTEPNSDLFRIPIGDTVVDAPEQGPVRGAVFGQRKSQ